MQESAISVSTIASSSLLPAESSLLSFELFAERAALRWVQRYISKFGGDPSKVTM